VTDGDPPARERILLAAERLFAEHGFDRTTTARLATAAGVPQGLIFYHFGTKQDLLLSLVRERSDTALAELGAPVGGDPHEAVAEVWRRLRDLLGTPSPLHRIVFRELDTHPALREHAQQLEREISEQVAGLLAGAVGRPGPPGPELLAAARMLAVTASVAAITHGDGGRGLDPGVVAQLLVDGLGGGADRATGRAGRAARPG
jgi:AcrR family transcriptional regulator